MEIMRSKIIFVICLAWAAGSPSTRSIWTQPSELCPPTGHWLLPHEWDCTKFYYCEYGEKWINPRDCAPGTHFSYELQVCIHPVIANCTLPNHPPTDPPPTEPTTTEETTTTTTTPEPTTTTTEAPTTTTTTPEPTTTTTTTTTTTEAPTTTTTTPEPTTTTTTTTTTEAPTTTTPEPTTTTTTPESTTTTTTTTTTEAPTTTTTTPEPTTTTTTTTTTEAPTTTTTTPEPTTTTTTTTTTEAPTTTTTTPEPTTTTTTTTTQPPTTTTTTPEPTTTTTTPEPTTTTTTTTTTEPPTTTTTTPEPTTTTTTPEPTTTTTTQAPTTTTTTPEPTTTTTKAPTTTQAPTTPSNPGLLPNGCPADFDIHQLLPHKECNKFYYCNFGEKVGPRTCPDGLYFNAELQVCDWPWNVDCDSDDGGGSGSGPDTLPNGCPADFDIHQLLPHQNCSKFYYCVFGEKEERVCPGDLHFNPVLQVCDWPWNAGCEGASTASPDSTGPPDVNPGPTPAPGPDTLPNGCPADFDVHQLLPHQNCSKFYYCVFGEKEERVCPGGLHFNPDLQVCDWPWNAGCEGASTASPDVTGPPDSVNPGPTPAPGPETLPNGCPADFDVYQLLPHEDCSKFYYCVFGEKQERVCPDGLHFNPELQACDWPWNAGCENDNSGSTEPGNPGTTPKPDSTTPGPSNPDQKCQQCNVLPWAHDSECDKFWRCEGEKAVLVTCSEGLHFNPSTALCDFICNANCDRNDVEATAAANGLKVFLPWDKVDNQLLELIEKMKSKN